jgi:hypothetical protein
MLMMKRLQHRLAAFATAGLLAAGAAALPGCDNGGGSDNATMKPSAEKQAEQDRINQETAAAHKNANKKHP